MTVLSQQREGRRVEERGGRINEGTSRVGVNNKKLCHLKYAAVSYLEDDGRC